MNWFNNFKIRTKILVCFIILAIFTGIVGVVGISNMNGLNDRSENIYNDNFIPSQYLSKIQTSLERVRANHLIALYERDSNTVQTCIDNIDNIVQQTNVLLEDYKSTILGDEEINLYNNLIDSMNLYRDMRTDHINLIKLQKYDEAYKLQDKVSDSRVKMDEELQALIDYNTLIANDSILKNADEFKSQTILMIIIILVSAILSIGLGLIVANLISKPLKLLVVGANKIADGNLDVSIDIDTEDEVGTLASSFRKMTDNLNDVMGNISNASEQVASGSRQVSDASIELSQGATEQASSIEQLTASIEEISSQTKLNADNASEANGLAEVAKENASQGNSQMKKMLRAMEDINESSSNISKIIKVIDEIAFQTNILALNAAVEAARAGQHGKGFSVVAEEVRNLAARSAKAAKETTDLIEGTIKKVEGGTKIATETSDALNKIVEDVAKVSNIVGDIAIASKEQELAISQINQGIMQVSVVVQTNSATSEESASASEELSSQAELLRGQVSKFNLRSNYLSYNEMDKFDPEMLRMFEKMTSSRNKHMKNSKDKFCEEAAVTSKSKNINLSDREIYRY